MHMACAGGVVVTCNVYIVCKSTYMRKGGSEKRGGQGGCTTIYGERRDIRIGLLLVPKISEGISVLRVTIVEGSTIIVVVLSLCGVSPTKRNN